MLFSFKTLPRTHAVSPHFKEVVVDAFYPRSFLWGGRLALSCRTGRRWSRDHPEPVVAQVSQQLFIVPVSPLLLVPSSQECSPLQGQVAQVEPRKGDEQGSSAAWEWNSQWASAGKKQQCSWKIYLSLTSVLIWELVSFRTFSSFRLPVFKGLSNWCSLFSMSPKSMPSYPMMCTFF